MGLDLVELVLEVENRFGVTIPDEEAQKITTPRKLIDWLGDKKVLPSPKSLGCRSQASFYRLRQAILGMVNLPKNAVRPATRLDSILPSKDLHAEWRCLKNRAGFRSWPDLTCTNKAGFLFFGTWFSIFLVGCAVFGFFGMEGLGLGVCLAVFLMVLGYWKSSLEWTIPTAWTTVGELALYPQEHDQRADAYLWTRRSIEATVKSLLEESVGFFEFPPNWQDLEFTKDYGLE